MKLLYLSCHGVLEYDELLLFKELGIDFFSHGCYTNPTVAGEMKREAVGGVYHDDLFHLAAAYGKDNLHPDMIKWADVVVCMHVVDWLTNNWEKLKGKRVIWRSIGQSTLNVENMLRPLRAQGLEIIRYSPREKTIPGFVGEDALIRFYKDPAEFNGWTGEEKRVITFGQSMFDRREFCNWSVFNEATKNYPRAIFGTPSKADDPLYQGQVDYRELKRLLRVSRVYFYTGTYPASYTLNFIEALMTGTPIVALGRALGNSPHEIGQNTYEVPDILDESGGGLYADDIGELKNYIKILMEDRAFASQISERGRQAAIKYFAKEKIKAQWKEFLGV